MTTYRDKFDAFAAQFKPSTPVEAAPKEQDPPGAIPESLVKSAKLASWIAYFALMYFLWERVLSVSEAKYETMAVTHIGPWKDLDLQIFFPLLVGYTFVVVGVPYVAKIAIPILVSLNWKEHLWPKAWAAVITVLVSVVLITGTATVGSDAIIESERDKAVAVEQVSQGRSVLEAQITGAEAELKSMMENSNAYLAQAASVGEEQWLASYVAQARREKDARLPMIERAAGAARAADKKRAEIKDLRMQLATSATVASVSSEVNTARTGPLNAMLGFLNAFWVLLLAVVMDITCLIMPWIALRLEQARNRQLAAARGETFIDKNGAPVWDYQHLALADLSDEQSPAEKAAHDAAYAVFAQGGTMEQATEAARRKTRAEGVKTRVINAETGEEEVLITPKPHWRKVPRGQRVKETTDPQIPLPDETGAVFASDSRAARSGVESGDGSVREKEDGAAGGGGEVEGFSGGASVPEFVQGIVSENGGDDTAATDVSPDDSSDFLADLIGPPQDVVDYGPDYGPPAPEKKLGADGKDGVLIAAE